MHASKTYKYLFIFFLLFNSYSLSSPDGHPCPCTCHKVPGSEITITPTEKCSAECGIVIELEKVQTSRYYTQPDPSCQSGHRNFEQKYELSGKERRTNLKGFRSYPLELTGPLYDPDADCSNCDPCPPLGTEDIECGKLYEICPPKPGDIKQTPIGEPIPGECVEIPI